MSKHAPVAVAPWQGEAALRPVIPSTLRSVRVLLLHRKSFNHALSLLGESMQ